MTTSNVQANIWLRDETKPNEKRAALSPQDARRLVQAGFKVTVESSETRIFSDEEYVRASCSLVASGSWKKAPYDAFILGLKELTTETTPLTHRHIYFAHAYKQQAGWRELITRFIEGQGLLLDLEYLTDDSGRRVAAFGRWAGFAGAALGIDLWSHRILSPSTPYKSVSAFPNRDLLVSHVANRLIEAMTKSASRPRVQVIGAKGRCGSGALDLLSSIGLSGSDITAWDKDETQTGGPFEEILHHDVLVNCVLVQGMTTPFLAKEMLDQRRTLKVVSDVSCDPHSPYNPLPIYEHTTTFTHPVTRLREEQAAGNPALDLTAIDHLPSLLPRESSEDFSAQLLPHLFTLGEGSNVWERAQEIFFKYVGELRK